TRILSVLATATPPPNIHTLSLHDALPISFANDKLIADLSANPALAKTHHRRTWPFRPGWQKEVHVWPFLLRVEFLAAIIVTIILDRKSTRLNSSHGSISYAVFCLKKKSIR